MSTKTTFEDLSKLGFPIMDVYNKANAQRGGTMHGTGDLALNSGFAAGYQWWSYNTTIGDPYLVGRKPTSISRQETAWSYDNTKNSEPYTETWTEKWTTKTSCSLTVAASASLTIEDKVTVANVASTGFTFTASLSVTDTQTQETSYEASRTFNMVVGPGEKLTLVRIITNSTEIADYAQAFSSAVSTRSMWWADHYFWGMSLNSLLNNPRGTLHLSGVGSTTSYAFTLVREEASGITKSLLPAHIPAENDPSVAHVPTAVLEKLNKLAKETEEVESQPVTVAGPK
ncbi:hypothetical protein CALCODRAFT_442777 [Calocera cornea HHB12733]|uniref:Cytolysin n=1 Tax=Calocera cornea HHB12733 TaxID=1353952 RepID=A0A165CY31_9BASI|nr:hypothetical protein CALCODRAFT_442777 [Calocera cornea HHB12733]